MTIPFNEHTSVNTVKVIIYLPDRDRFGFPVDSDYWFANFATNPPHDSRKHRRQGEEKRPFTQEELEELGLERV